MTESPMIESYLVENRLSTTPFLDELANGQGTINPQWGCLVVGRDFRDVTPLKGIVYSVGKQKMEVSLNVRNMNRDYNQIV